MVSSLQAVHQLPSPGPSAAPPGPPSARAGATPTAPSAAPAARGSAPVVGVLAPATPYLDLDVGAAVTHYRRLGAALPGTAVHYAVKANPDPALLVALVDAGCRFAVASPAEVVAVLEAGAAPADLICSNPVKRRTDISFAAQLGVRVFVVDSLEETAKVADAAPGTSVLCRLVTSGEGSDWPLSRTYGCSTDQAVDILRAAADAELDPAGVSFHVGSQQHDPGAWDAPIAASARAFERLRGEGLHAWLLDLGGGLPAHLEDGAPPLACYGAAIELQLRRHFRAERPRTIVEPGRAIAADGGPTGPGRDARAVSEAAARLTGALSERRPARARRPAPSDRWPPRRSRSSCAAAPRG